MYQLPAFREDDHASLYAFIGAHPLGLLISAGEAGLLANPIPFLAYAQEGDKGVMRCHLSRGNTQWHALRDGAETLIVFQGADGYVTPSWYKSKAEHGKVVPTWNYAVVQVRGTARVMEDPAWLHANVSALSDAHELERPRPWSVSDAPDAFIAGQLRGIVGVEIAVSTIEGKFKFSQNRAESDRNGVAAGLANEAGSTDHLAMVKARNGL
ncbi:FMN-binding negative transcriptional regulator [Devosia sp.]|uniref:FMN-binding negative transcriptional regulator n=1 Tax=Devosia sp. TaxID=1871048 RepID=UPI00273415EF|nr:FMN-binding negative transcriptional regulator [Devosia sp.]MDP2781849.1 FMN-binding negative transcriptional regulator [Devosia sp.]